MAFQVSHYIESLKKGSIQNKVVSPASIEVKANDRVKTDKIDALKIASHLESGRLKSIYIPSIEEENRRSLSRGREQAVERRKRVGNQLKMKLHYLGVKIIADKKLSESFLKWAEKLKLPPGHKLVTEEYISSWREETKRIHRFGQALNEQAKIDKNEVIYRSAPGVGPISSRVLSNELGDMSRFNNERQLFSASGLTPCEYSSGEHIRRGHISRQGSPRIRGLMVEIAWRAIKKDINLSTFYQSIASKKGGKKAIVATARKMLGRLRKCLRDKKIWIDMPITEGRA